MGKSETALVSLGHRISLSDLVAQITTDNCKWIEELLVRGTIEDENGFFNEVFRIVIDGRPAENVKEYLLTQLVEQGSLRRYKFGGEEPTLEDGCLLDQFLLVSNKDLLATERWGHDREGTNTSSRPLDFTLALEPLAGITGAQPVLIVLQHSG
jgi:hypothetical protein